MRVMVFVSNLQIKNDYDGSSIFPIFFLFFFIVLGMFIGLIVFNL